MWPDLFGVVVHHARGVVYGQHDLILSLAGFGATEPDLVLAELTGDVRNHLPHVQSFPCPVVSPTRQQLQHNNNYNTTTIIISLIDFFLTLSCQ